MGKPVDWADIVFIIAATLAFCTLVDCNKGYLAIYARHKPCVTAINAKLDSDTIRIVCNPSARN